MAISRGPSSSHIGWALGLRYRFARVAAATSCTLLIVSCAVGPNFEPPAHPTVSRYTVGFQPTRTVVADGQAQRFVSKEAVPSAWWQQFGSSEIDADVAQAYRTNPNVRAAEATLRESQDLLRSGYGIFYPQISGEAAASRQVSTPQRSNLKVPPGIFNLFTASTSVSYALDLFGGERRTVESLAAQRDLQRYELQAAYLSLTANVVNTVIAHAAYLAEITSTNKLINIARKQVHLARVQVNAGTAPYSDVLTLRAQLDGFETTLPPLRQKLDETEDLLASLLGCLPAQLHAPNQALASIRLPTAIPISVPSALARKRPDILAAEAELHIASAQIGVATAALFPNITLGGSYGADSNVASTLFHSASGFWDMGANLSVPLFQGWTLWFQRKAVIDRFRQAQAAYRETVLSAFAQRRRPSRSSA